MPTFSRKQLRRDLAQRYTHDLGPINVNAQGPSLGAALFGTFWSVADARTSDLSGSGQNLFQGAWLYLEGSTAGADLALTLFQYRVASFNIGSGAFLLAGETRSPISTVNVFEVHTRVPPMDKDLAVDETILRLRLRQEVALTSAGGGRIYAIDGAASPHLIERILDVHVAANPGASQDLTPRSAGDWDIVSTATGNQLRLSVAVDGSQQILLDAILAPTLSGGELATINVPDERWILAGAAVKCYDFLIQDAPGQQVQQLQQRRAEVAAEFSRLSTRFAPEYAQPIRLHDTIRGAGGWWS